MKVNKIVINQMERKLDLGTILCKYCGCLMGTIPTNGVKKFYGVCQSEPCQQLSKGGH